MGLAASQARLLTITSRKSRAQFENMRLSHQKLALSRSLTDISNEYQNSLNQTKLYYDFYGVNSTDTPLTYNMLMSPSSINDYTPTLITNNQGQVVLATPYANAARAAGIPMEGLGCQPSSILREAFIWGLYDNGVITKGTAEAILSVDYNQGAGLGASNLVNTQTTYGDFSVLLEKLGETAGDTYLTPDLLATNDTGNGRTANLVYIEGSTSYTFSNTYNDKDWMSGFATKGSKSLEECITLADLLDAGAPSSSNKHLYAVIESGSDGRFAEPTDAYQALLDTVYNVTGMLGAKLNGILAGAGDAIAYADLQMQSELGVTISDLKNKSIYKNLHSGKGKEKYNGQVATAAIDKSVLGGKSDNNIDAENTLGLMNNRRTSWVLRKPLEAVGALDLTDFVRAWFTYFMQYMHGLGTAEANELDINWGSADTNSTFANKDNIGEYQFTFTSTAVNDNEALIANFYDTLFNQICMSGWTENTQIDKDSNYLKEMLQSGMMYVTSMSDDYYFYQNNYATNSFIKEVADDAAIAEAESKYTTQKARINAKEQELDLKMKNLDTEISSLETEYEAVKKVIENNASKSFTRYDG